jgi:type II secretory pathway pseudopilin PulG
MLLVIGIMAIAAAFSIPQVIGARRLIRSSGVTRELISGLRDARQMAVTRRRAVTFQFDTATQQVNIIDHGVNVDGMGVSGISVLTDGSYPNTPGSSVARTVSLTESGLPASEIGFGVPAGVSTQSGKLGDNTTIVAASSLTSNKLNITFEPDGTIINTTGTTKDVAFSIYNTVDPHDTAAAVSILGATGRIKAWRYSASVDKFIE